MRRKPAINAPTGKVLLAAKAALAVPAGWVVDPLAGIVDPMAAQAKKNSGRGLDLAIRPEVAITGEAGDDAVAHSVSFEGEVKDAFTRKAREHSCYIAVPTCLLDSKACVPAREQRRYIVSSTWRHNASIFEPTGKVV